MTTAAGSPGTASDGYRVPVKEGRHRAPPTVPTPRARTVIAATAAVLTAASLVAIALTPPPHASAAGVRGVSVSTVTRAERTDAGPLVLPTIGVVAPAIESLYPTTENALSRPRSVPRVQGHVPTPLSASTGQPEVLTTPPQQTVTPAPQPVTTTTADAPPPTTAAAEDLSSATPTPEETAVTPEPTEPTVTVDVTAEVTP